VARGAGGDRLGGRQRACAAPVRQPRRRRLSRPILDRRLRRHARGQLRAAQAARRRLAAELERERETKARLEGELNAARAIQMGLVPRKFPPFPERRDIDLDAIIEPARTVGGDLYDFLLIGPDRLFFAIADVSGKASRRPCSWR